MEINRPLPSLISNLYQENKNLGSTLSTQSDNDLAPNTSNPSQQAGSSELSLSIRSQKLSAISKEFFNGPIASENIAALSQSLYENGFINNQELQAMGAETPEQTTITQSKHFISSFMFEASKQGDEATLSMLEPIAQAINNMDAASTSKQRQIEVVALDNAKQMLSHLNEVGADEALIKEFENVVDVLSTLDTLRQSDRLKQGVAEYETIQNEYDDLFSGPPET
jgi:hemoglobin-like flavoprotein